MEKRKIYIHHCLHCDNDWASKNPHPKRCGVCKTPNWDKPRKYKRRK